MPTKSHCLVALTLTLLVGALISVYGQSPPSGFDRDRGRTMLNVIKNDLKKNYYDPNFHGMNVDARFQEADEKIKNATSLGHIFGIIAQALIDLNDSHTTFCLPEGLSPPSMAGTCR